MSAGAVAIGRSSTPGYGVAVPVGMALAIMAVSVASMLISVPFGLAVCFVATAAFCVSRPADTVAFVVTGFVFQNLLVAGFTPIVPDIDFFNTLRGANFIMLMAAFLMFVLATLNGRLATVPAVRPWVLAVIVVLVVIALYFAIGAMRADVRNAIIYLRNTLTPIACFAIALAAAALYRVELGRALTWITGAAAVYGYCELFFGIEFLSLFNGDAYIKLQMTQQIETGYWENLLKQTGFVLRGLDDIFLTAFLNTPLFEGLVPPVWRIAGPNFHPISYAYVLSIVSVAHIVRGRWALVAFVLPLLVIIGSKGALAVFGIAIAARVIHAVAGPRLALFATFAAAAAWITVAIVLGISTGDFHVLGLFAGLRDFVANPLGQGLGIGGNISSDAARLDWSQAQADGIANVPVESAVGVMLYQMGVGAFAFFGLIAALAIATARRFLVTGRLEFLTCYVLLVVISANAVLQEEAFYSPLVLGLALLITGVTLGTDMRTARRTTA